MRVEISGDGGTWSPVDATPQDRADGWEEIAVDRDARAVRIVISGTGGAESIGGIAELRIDPPDGG